MQRDGVACLHLARVLANWGLQPGRSIVDECESALDRPCEVFLQLVD